MKTDIQYKYPSINHYFCDNTECVSMVVKLMASIVCIQKLLGNEVYVHDLCLNQIEKLETQVFCNIETEDLKILLKMFVSLMCDYAGDAEVLETRARAQSPSAPISVASPTQFKYYLNK